MPFGEHELAYWSMTPPGPRRTTGLVVVPSFLDPVPLDADEVALARGAAAAGIPSLCMHPPGSWASTGGLEDAPIALRVDVALLAAARLTTTFPEVGSVCFFGSRLGGAVATIAASGYEGNAHLLLWDPAYDVDAYWRRLSRIARLSAVSARAGVVEQPLDQLRSAGVTTVAGTAVSNEVAADLGDVEARLATAPISGSVLVVAPSRALPRQRVLLDTLSGDVVEINLGRGTFTGGFPDTDEIARRCIAWLDQRA